MLDKKRLMDFLRAVGEKLDGEVEVTAVGGTAMTLLGIKASTLDIDFNADSESHKAFKKALAGLQHGYRIDLYSGGLIFSQQLPEDYVSKRLPVKAGFKRLKLYALHPLDIVATKIGRLNERDIEDIGDCIRAYRLTKKEVSSRAEETEYVGRRESYETNLRYVLGKLF